MEPVARRLVEAVVAFVLASLLAACAAQPRVDVLVSRVLPANSTMFEQRARIDLTLRNFSDRSIEAAGMSLELDVNGRRFASGVSNRPFTVPALGETSTSVVVGISVVDVVRQLLGLEGRQTFDYVLRGRIAGGGLIARNARFTRRGEFTRAQLASLAGSATR